MKNAWTNGNEYVFSDQADFNPNIEATRTGSRWIAGPDAEP
jgi:hypothetical protein